MYFILTILEQHFEYEILNQLSINIKADIQEYQDKIQNNRSK